MEQSTEVLVAHAYFQAHDAHPLAHMCPLPPLQTAELAAWLSQEAGATVSQWDSTFRVGTDSFEIAVSRIAPSVVWVYTHPTSREWAPSLLAAARKSGAAVLVGGPDARLRPALYLRAGADAVIPGRGEATSLALLEALRGQAYRPSEGVLKAIPGLYYLDGSGTVRMSEGEGAFVDSERLPRPTRDPVDTRIHLQRWTDVGRSPGLSLRSAWGCPYPCGYCTNSVSARPYRRRSPASVVDEMEELAYAYDLDRLIFEDETFLSDSLWLTDFAGELSRRGLRIAFEASGHPAHVEAAVLPLLRDVGLDHVDLHAASGSSALLRSLDFSYSPADIYRASGLLRDAGVDVGLAVLVGLPGEGRADLDASIEMIRTVGPDGVEVTRVDPGSPALFRKDWERVVAGPLLDRVLPGSPPPPAILEAAVTWMRSYGRSRSSAGEDALRQFAGKLGRPLLRALVRGLPR